MHPLVRPASVFPSSWGGGRGQEHTPGRSPLRPTHTHTLTERQTKRSPPHQNKMRSFLAGLLNMCSRKINDQSGSSPKRHKYASAERRRRSSKVSAICACSQMTDYTCSGSAVLHDLSLCKGLRVTCYLGGVSAARPSRRRALPFGYGEPQTVPAEL